MPTYYKLFMAAAVALLVWPTSAQAQDYTTCPADEDVCVVEYFDGENPIINALRNTIENDENRPEGRVYQLKRGGLYYNEDRIENAGFHLRIIGETEDVVPPGETDFGPAVIQMVTRGDGSVDQRMITGQNDITLQNLWITGQDDAGLTTAYTPIQIDASGHTFVFDNVIFERSDFALVHFTGENNDVTVTNSVFRNFTNKAQQWEGRGIQFASGANRVIVENNTFFNIGMTVIQSEAAPLNYIRFNHNTLVNVGRSINTGAIWREAYFTNNIVVNGFWHGEGHADQIEPNRDTETAGLFSIAELPAEFGTNLERKIVFANTATWRDPQFASYYADSILAQPLFNEVTDSFFVNHDNMVAQDLFEDTNPELAIYPTLVADGIIEAMIANISDLRNGITPAEPYQWDPGRDPSVYQGSGFVWPLPEDFTYSNSALRSAGTDDLPLGDLNWYPDDKATFEANRDRYVEDIENMVSAPEVNVVASGEFEDGEVGGGATVERFEGDTWLTLQPGTAFEWTFEVPEEKQYDIRLHVNMAGRETSGLDMILNGDRFFDLRGWDQFVIPAEGYGGALDEWVELEYSVDDLADRSPDYTAPSEVMTLSGENTLRIQSSWAENTQWRGVDIVDPASGEVVAELRAPGANNDGSTEGCDADYCPRGFASVNLENGSVSMNFDIPSGGDHFMRIFYNAESTQDLQISLDDEVVFPSVSFGPDENNVVTETFAIADAGVRKVTFSTTGGPINLDWMQIMSVTSTSTDRHMLPEGYALKQNYPNPFSRRTIIEYEMGQTGHALVQVFDLLGRRVATLVNADMPSGVHQIEWDGRTDNGAVAASGVYFYRMQVAGAQKTRSMVVVR